MPLHSRGAGAGPAGPAAARPMLTKRLLKFVQYSSQRFVQSQNHKPNRYGLNYHAVGWIVVAEGDFAWEAELIVLQQLVNNG